MPGKSEMLIEIIKEWLKWHKNWDDLCTRCGKCCYQRRVEPDGTVLINYACCCEHLDRRTNLCKIYNERFEKCDYCKKVGLWVSMFNPTLPNDCPYRTTFRPWERKKESGQS